MDYRNFFFRERGVPTGEDGRPSKVVRSEVIRSPFCDFGLMDGQYSVVLVLVRGETLNPSKTAPFWFW
jgi:hypothetical protein